MITGNIQLYLICLICYSTIKISLFGISKINLPDNFNRFIEIVKEETAKGDTRPIYIFNFFERLDDATDITLFIDALATLDRQVFVGVSSTYPIERFENDKVQLV